MHVHAHVVHTRLLTGVYAPRAQKETEGQKISEANTEKPKPQVRFALPRSPLPHH